MNAQGRQARGWRWRTLVDALIPTVGAAVGAADGFDVPVDHPPRLPDGGLDEAACVKLSTGPWSP